MADFFDGKTIRQSIHTPDGIAAGWVPISGINAFPVPPCEPKYWKIQGGGIIEMSQEEKDLVDNPPQVEDPRIKEVDTAEASGVFTPDQAEVVRKILGGSLWNQN